MNLVETLVGESLSGVVFVMDYIQLQLDGSLVTYSVNPTILTEDIELGFGDRDYRNALCELIGTEVSGISASASGTIIIEFGASRIEAERGDDSPETAGISLADGRIIVV